MHGPTGIFWANLTPFSLQWLTDHCEDPTADGPLTIAQAKKALKPKLTPEPQAAEALGKGSKAAAAPAGSSDTLAFGTGPSIRHGMMASAQSASRGTWGCRAA